MQYLCLLYKVRLFWTNPSFCEELGVSNQDNYCSFMHKLNGYAFGYRSVASSGL